MQGFSLPHLLNQGLALRRLLLELAGLDPWIGVARVLSATEAASRTICKEIDFLLAHVSSEHDCDVYDLPRETGILLQVPGIAVLSKPVCRVARNDEREGRAPEQLVRFGSSPMFVNCLDVPSSGLVLAACTFEGYFGLVQQVDALSVERGYILLCHAVASEMRPCKAGAQVESSCRLPAVLVGVFRSDFEF